MPLTSEISKTGLLSSKNICYIILYKITLETRFKVGVRTWIVFPKKIQFLVDCFWVKIYRMKTVANLTSIHFR